LSAVCPLKVLKRTHIGFNLSKSQIKTVLNSARFPNKQSDLVGHAFTKHAPNNPKIWGNQRGGPKQWSKDGMNHLRDIIRGPGKFKRVKNDDNRFFYHKTLEDGRGVRLNLDYTFKEFID